MSPLATFLADRGHLTVAPHLRGYGPTGPAPDGRYDLEALAKDILGLASALGHERFVIVGHDWGAAIGYVVAAMAPERVIHLFALSVPPLSVFLNRGLRSPRQLWRSRYMLFFQLPYLPELSLRMSGSSGVRRLWRRWSASAFFQEHLEHACSNFQQPGRAEGGLAYYRSFFRLHRKGSRRAWRLGHSALTVPTLVISGADDQCIGPEIFEGMDCPLELIPGSGHFLPSEAPTAVGEIIVAQLSQISGVDGL